MGTTIDDLTYYYSSHTGNKVQRIEDAIDQSITGGFPDLYNYQDLVEPCDPGLPPHMCPPPPLQLPISGQIVTLKTVSLEKMFGNIWSDTAGRNISTNGFHRGVLVDGFVYDNIHKAGIKYDDWIKDFHTPGNELKKTFEDF